MEEYYPEGFIPTTGGSIRIVPVELPTVSLRYETLVSAGAEFDVEVKVSDCIEFPFTLLLNFNELIYAIKIVSDNFTTKLKAPPKAGTYKITLNTETVYLFNNRDIAVVDCVG